MRSHRLTSHTIDSLAQLRALIAEPTAALTVKITNSLNECTRRFVEASPLVFLATANERGECDVSPRGDPAGFTRIIDDRTLLFPERPGNKIADSLRNILSNPHLGAIFVIPGVNDSLRVNGVATLTTDAELLAPCIIEGKLSRLGILLDIREAYTQCPKAFLRSHCWDPEHFTRRDSLPTGGEILRAIQGESFDADDYDQQRAGRYARREGFY